MNDDRVGLRSFPERRPGRFPRAVPPREPS